MTCSFLYIDGNLIFHLESIS